MLSGQRKHPYQPGYLTNVHAYSFLIEHKATLLFQIWAISVLDPDCGLRTKVQIRNLPGDEKDNGLVVSLLLKFIG